MQKYFITLALAISFLVAANVQAGLVTFYDNKDALQAGTYATDWTFGPLRQVGNDSSPMLWNFNLVNGENSVSGASLQLSVFNGASGTQSGPTVSNGVLSVHHNSANRMDISFGNADFVGSFYMSLTPHSSWKAADMFYVTADYMLDGKMLTTDQVAINENNLFFGIALDEGAYLSAIRVWSTGTNNNGINVAEMGFRGAAIPEPGTLAMLGLGLAGLGVARRRMKK